MGGFGPSYVFITLGFFFIRIMGSPPRKMGDKFFCVRSEGGVDEGGWGALLENLGRGHYLGGWCFLVLVLRHLL